VTSRDKKNEAELAFLILGVMMGGVGNGDGARFPEVAEHMDAEEFDFFEVVARGAFNVFSPLVAEEAEANGNLIALLFVALEDELEIALAEAFPGQPEANFGMFAFLEGGGGGSAFDQIIRIGFFGIGSFEEFEDFTGGNGGRGRSEETAAGFSDRGGISAEFFRGADALLILKPTLKTVSTPEGEVLFMDGDALELGGENPFNSGKLVEPGEDFAGVLVVKKTLVELLADIGGETGDFADEGAVGAIIDRVWFGHGGEKVWVGHSF
jgi:hypothetical protein